MTDTSIVEPRRTRTRRTRDVLRTPEARQKAADRVIKFYDDDLADSSVERELRLQRYAKYRMWKEGKDWPWPNASDTSVPDIMEKVLRTNDTLHNAVMIQRPPVGSKALKKTDKDKQDKIDKLIDFQFFDEQDGENIVGDLAEEFTISGVFTAFIPWVKEKREVRDTRTFDPIPDNQIPSLYFHGLLRQTFPNALYIPKGEAWDWDVRPIDEEEESFEVRFYTKSNNRVELVAIREVIVYDGPRVIVKDFDDVYHPPRSANLQIPGPSNPGGASHVILRDQPTVDEIKRLAKSGFYDVKKEDLDKLENTQSSLTDEEAKVQKDDIQGVTKNTENVKSHRTLTRLVCFDMFDIDGDGIDEDVIFWVLRETKTLLKVAALTDLYPANPPRRPFAEASMIPIKGRRCGISMPEMLEGMHDVLKQIFDQTIDAGTIRNVPFGFYRATGTMKPEILSLLPGELYPLGDPQRDIAFPTIGNNNSDAFGLNMISLISSQEEKLTSIGDIQQGRVPAGKSSALRTASGIAQLLGQGEARPERMLRRFFMGLCEIWAQIHELNQQFLPKDKQFRVFGVDRPGEDPYDEVKDRDEIKGRFQFTFSANVLNASKQAMQEALGSLASLYISPLTLQLGMIDGPGIYRLLRDIGKAQGQDPDRYLVEPEPGAMKEKIFAEDAIQQIMNSEIPNGVPAEGAAGHLRRLVEFERSIHFGLLSPNQVQIYQGYKQITERLAQDEERRRQALADAAGQFGQGGGQPGRPPEGPGPSLEQPQVSGGELLDESLPTAGGGGTQ